MNQGKCLLLSLMMSALLIPGPAMHAQDISIGISAGPNFATFHGSLNELRKFRVGIHGGLTANIGFSGDWGIRAEILYSQQGILWKDGQAQFKIKNDYLSIPFLLTFQFNDRINVEFGPGIGILLKSQEIIKYPAYEEVKDTKGQYNQVDIGIYLGVRYSFGDHFSAGLRYYNGLMWAEMGANRRINAHFQIPLTWRF